MLFLSRVRWIYFVFFLSCLWQGSCKHYSIKQEPTQTIVDNSQSEFSLKLTEENVCKGSYEVNESLIENPNNNYSELSEFETSEVKKVLHDTISAIPAEIQSDFVKYNGSFEFTKSIYEKCGIDKSKEGIPFVASCWVINPDNKSFKLFISVWDGSFSTVAVSQNTLSSIGRIFDQLFQSFFVDKSGAYLEVGESSMSFPSMQMLGELNQNQANKIPVEYAEYVFSTIFFEYFCSVNSKENLKLNAPVAFSLFEVIEQEYSSPTNLDLVGGKPKLKASVKSKESLKVGSRYDLPSREGLYRKPWFPFVPFYKGKPKLVGDIPKQVPVGSEKPTITILVHGTFNADLFGKGKWANPMGDYAKEVKKQFGGEVLSLQWSGGLDSASRTAAADVLNKEILELSKKYKVNLIAHSHGANIAIEALNKGNIQVHEFHSLARPAREDYSLESKVLPKIGFYHIAYAGWMDITPLFGGNPLKGIWASRRQSLQDFPARYKWAASYFPSLGHNGVHSSELVNTLATAKWRIGKEYERSSRGKIKGVISPTVELDFSQQSRYLIAVR